MQLMKAYMAKTSYNQLSLTDSATYELICSSRSIRWLNKVANVNYTMYSFAYMCVWDVCVGVGGGLVLLTSLAAVLNTYSK